MMTIPPEVLARIDQLELDAKQVVEGYMAGRHRSPRHGFAVEFAQHREYAPGDDIKHIDWKVFARTERYHLKQYEQETNLVARLIVDASESMKVGTVRQANGNIRTKYDAACILAGALAQLLTQQGDSVGLAMPADRIRTQLKASSTTAQPREILARLAEGPFSTPSNLGKLLQELGGTLGRRGLIFVFSDLLDEVEDLTAALRVLRSHRHEVVLFQVLDAAELDFDFRQPTLFRGLENLPALTTDPASIRESYLAELQKHLRALESVARSHEAELVLVRTDDDLGRVLASYLGKRAA